MVWLAIQIRAHWKGQHVLTESFPAYSLFCIKTGQLLQINIIQFLVPARQLQSHFRNNSNMAKFAVAVVLVSLMAAVMANGPYDGNWKGTYGPYGGKVDSYGSDASPYGYEKKGSYEYEAPSYGYEKRGSNYGYDASRYGYDGKGSGATSYGYNKKYDVPAYGYDKKVSYGYDASPYGYDKKTSYGYEAPAYGYDKYEKPKSYGSY